VDDGFTYSRPLASNRTILTNYLSYQLIPLWNILYSFMEYVLCKCPLTTGDDMKVMYAGKSHKAEVIFKDSKPYLILGEINVIIPLLECNLARLSKAA